MSKKGNDTLKGTLYASLATSSDSNKLTLRCSQKVFFGDHIAVKAFAMFEDGKEPRVRTQVKVKQNLKAIETRTSGRLRRDSLYDISGQMLKGTVYVKKRFDINKKTTLNVKGELHLKAKTNDLKDPRVDTDVQSRIELSHKLLNITDTQDARVRLGLDVINKAAYFEIRENHLTLKADSKGSWSLLYDI